MSTDLVMNLGGGILRRVDGQENPIFVDTGDIDVINGKINLLSTDDKPRQVGQRLYIGLNLRQGEWFADINSGFPYRLFAKFKTRKEVFDNLMRSYILSHEGVTSLTSYTSELDNATRLMRIRFEATLQNGRTTDLEVSL